MFRTLATMYPSCPVCGTRFEREPGYFVGAMYISYGLAIPLYLAIVFLLEAILHGWSDLAVYATALALFVPFAPLLFRVSRLLWMYLDRAIDRNE